MTSKFTPKTVNITLTLYSEEEVKRMEDFRNKYGLENEAQVLLFAYKFTLDLDLRHNIHIIGDSKTWVIEGLAPIESEQKTEN